jgi:acyl-coenzyme A thioesterase PaaI-like protein
MPDMGDFPPDEHVGRDLHIAYRLTDRDRIELTIPVVEEILRPDGTVQSEALTTILDEATGFIAVFSAMPGWSSTASLAFGFPRPVIEPRGELVVDGRVVKAGKRVIFVEADVWWGEQLVAHAAGEFARVNRADRNVDMEMPDPDPDQVFALALPDSGLEVPFPRRLGMEIVDREEGMIDMAFGPYTRNSSGILHGGVVGALAVASAEVAAGAPASAAHVLYLSPGRVGPFRTRAARRYEDGGRAIVWRTQTFDAGNGGRPMTHATVTTGAPVDGAR